MLERTLQICVCQKKKVTFKIRINVYVRESFHNIHPFQNSRKQQWLKMEKYVSTEKAKRSENQGRFIPVCSSRH